jgi:uncharacterized alkaline shock family protein YloU
MIKEINTNLGQIKIAEDVIATIVGNAATECYGLVGMASRGLQDGIAELLGRENLSRGVVINNTEQGIEVDIYIIVEYGLNIPEVARNVMEKVKYIMNTKLGVDVDKVNINVQGVRVTTMRNPKSATR